MFGEAVRLLNHLDQYVNLELRPPTVVLDATNSRDRKTVLATLTDHPQKPQGINNLLVAVTRNGRFRRLNVQPGDRVRYYAMTDEHGKARYIELTVKQVLSDNVLVIEGGLSQPVVQPMRMEIWRFDDQKIQQIWDRVQQYVNGEGLRIGWEPAPDDEAIAQMIDRFNAWIRHRDPHVDWEASPLVATLPEDLRSPAAPEILAATDFELTDGRRLQESIWLRDIAGWAAGRALEDLQVATQLFDWTIRNIQLETDEGQGGPIHDPWQTLMYGRGTAEDRAWVFILLARQLGLDVVMLATAGEQGKGAQVWTAALLSEGEFFLFDPRLGLPVPAADERQIATLAAARSDPQILQRLNLPNETPYPVQANDLAHVVALVEGSPLALSRRAAAVEQRLTNESRAVLTAPTSTLKERLMQTGQIDEVRLWERPYRTRKAQQALDASMRRREAQRLMVFAFQPYLWKARVLHFRGEFHNGNETRSLYRKSRMMESRGEPADDSDEKRLLTRGRQDATYWLGLLSADAGQHEVAVDFFENRTLLADPDGPWTDGARYNLARAYESLGKIDEAAALYESDTSPQRIGNRLRASMLTKRPAAGE